jgi:hypothetical protein
MAQELTLHIPTDWNDVSLDRYLKLQNLLKQYADDEEATTAILLMELCGLDAAYLNALAVEDFLMLRNELSKFITKTEYELQRFVKWDGVEYGFEPNLSQMSYGAYLDISKFGSLAIDDNWVKIMNILYRPVTERKGDMYSIEPYTLKDRTDIIKQWGMDIHFGALFFFVRLSTDLVSSIPNFLKGVEHLPNIKQILAKSGEVTNRLLNLQEGI